MNQDLWLFSAFVLPSLHTFYLYFIFSCQIVSALLNVSLAFSYHAYLCVCILKIKASKSIPLQSEQHPVSSCRTTANTHTHTRTQQHTSKRRRQGRGSFTSGFLWFPAWYWRAGLPSVHPCLSCVSVKRSAAARGNVADTYAQR